MDFTRRPIRLSFQPILPVRVKAEQRSFVVNGPTIDEQRRGYTVGVADALVNRFTILLQTNKVAFGFDRGQIRSIGAAVAEKALTPTFIPSGPKLSVLPTPQTAL